jgi:hypothetical protein
MVVSGIAMWIAAKTELGTLIEHYTYVTTQQENSLVNWTRTYLNPSKRLEMIGGKNSGKTKQFQTLYRTLLTPIGLVVTVSGVFYANSASALKDHTVSFLTTYQVLIGSAVVILILSIFLYASAHMTVGQYRRGLSQWAFGTMMFAAFSSSSVLVAPLASMWIDFADRALLVSAVAIGYILIGVVMIFWFCRSKL